MREKVLQQYNSILQFIRLINNFRSVWGEHAPGGEADDLQRRVQRGRVQHVRPTGLLWLVPQLPRQLRRLQHQNPLRLQAALPGAPVNEHRPQAQTGAVLLNLRKRFDCQILFKECYFFRNNCDQ